MTETGKQLFKLRDSNEQKDEKTKKKYDNNIKESIVKKTKNKMAQYSLSGLLQVSRCSKNLNWFEKTLFTRLQVKTLTLTVSEFL